MVRFEVLEIGGVDFVPISCRHDTATVPLDHRGRSAGEISQRVGEIGVIALLESFPGKVAIAIEWNLAQEEISERIRPITADGVAQIEIAAGRLADARAADQHEAMNPDAVRHRDAGSHQHRRPNHGVEPGDILADQM